MNKKKVNLICQHFLVFIFFILLTLVITYPLIVKISGFLPNESDPFQDTWVLSSFARKIVSLDFKNFFDGNIFYPHQLTLAYTENLLSFSVLILPVVLITKNPVLAHNLIVFLSFVLPAFGIYLLVLNYTKNLSAALLSGIFFGFAPFRYLHNFLHLNLSGFFLPFLILALEKCLKKITKINIFLLIFTIIIYLGSSLYYSVFLPFFYLLFFSVRYVNSSDKKTVIKVMLITLMITLTVGIMITIPYYKLSQEGFVRLPADVDRFSPSILNYFISPLFYPKVFDQEWLVTPGLVLIVLFAISLLVLIKSKEIRIITIRSNFYLYLSLALIAFCLSLGMKYSFWPGHQSLPSLFYFLYYLVPGFNGMRGLGRMSIFVILSLSVIIGYAASYLLKRYVTNLSKKIIAFFIISVIIILFFLEVVIIKPANYLQARPVPSVYYWLNQQEDKKVILELPLNLSYYYEYYSVYHWHKLINGYSGYEPADYGYLKNKLKFFSPRGDYQIIKNYQTDYLIMHYNYYPQEEQMRIKRELTESNNYQLIAQFGSDCVYQVQ